MVQYINGYELILDRPSQNDRFEERGERPIFVLCPSSRVMDSAATRKCSVFWGSEFSADPGPTRNEGRALVIAA